MEAWEKKLILFLAERGVSYSGTINKKTRNIREKEQSPFTIREFTPHIKEQLQKDGFFVYSLKGKSIQALIAEGKKIAISKDAYGEMPGFSHIPLFAISLDVAILPELFLPGSFNLSFPQQKTLVDAYSKQISQKYGKVKAIIGEAYQYTELVFQHSLQTGRLLFGSDFRYGMTRTQTPLSQPILFPIARQEFATIGPFTENGLFVGGTINKGVRRGAHYPNLGIAPLFVPA